MGVLKFLFVVFVFVFLYIFYDSRQTVDFLYFSMFLNVFGAWHEKSVVRQGSAAVRQRFGTVRHGSAWRFGNGSEAVRHGSARWFSQPKTFSLFFDKECADFIKA